MANYITTNVDSAGVALTRGHLRDQIKAANNNWWTGWDAGYMAGLRTALDILREEGSDPERELNARIELEKGAAKSWEDSRLST